VGNEKVRDQMCMKENFDCGNPEDHERRNSWPTEELLPGFRHFTEDFFQVQVPPPLSFPYVLGGLTFLKT